MNSPFIFSDVLGHYTRRAGYNISQLARLSGLPNKTIDNWVNGRVKRPREQSDLFKLAQVLHLNLAEATQLFMAAQYPGIEKALHQKSDTLKETTLVSTWQHEASQLKLAPFQSPPTLPYFVGHEQELAFIKQVLLHDQRCNIMGLTGMGGIGKTALAIQASYVLRPYFPNGVLWANVGRSDTLSILKTFANAFQFNFDETNDVASYGRVVRELLANKRVLIIIDNAKNSGQIRPLLPPTGKSAVIVTTRRQNLAALSGTHHLRLSGLNPKTGDDLTLFEHMLGQKIRDEHIPLINQLSQMVGYLPMAVAIMAKKLAYELDWTPSQLLQQMRPENNRLSQLIYENQDIEEKIAQSFNQLTSNQRQQLSTLNKFGNNQFTLEEVCQTSGLLHEHVAKQLRSLYDFSLIHSVTKNCFKLHPLVSTYLSKTKQVFK